MEQKALRIVQEVQKSVIGKENIILKTLLAIFADGHILLEDNPGVGKTTLALAFSKVMQLDYKRLQFTPEIMPADVLGFSVYQKESSRLKFMTGPIFCNLFLADEINRTSSKTQSALLEAMEENSVTIDSVTHSLPLPFLVIATQNPYGSAGTQRLPESQLDRFMLCLSMGYPELQDEVKIMQQNQEGFGDLQPIVTGDEILQIQSQVSSVYLSDEIYHYIAKIVTETRKHSMITLGVSPRGSIALSRISRAAAWMSGRDYVIPSDIQLLAQEVLSHRIVLNRQARFSDKTATSILDDIIHSIRPPKLV